MVIMLCKCKDGYRKRMKLGIEECEIVEESRDNNEREGKCRDKKEKLAGSVA